MLTKIVLLVAKSTNENIRFIYKLNRNNLSTSIKIHRSGFDFWRANNNKINFVNIKSILKSPHQREHKKHK